MMLGGYVPGPPPWEPIATRIAVGNFIATPVFEDAGLL